MVYKAKSTDKSSRFAGGRAERRGNSKRCLVFFLLGAALLAGGLALWFVFLSGRGESPPKAGSGVGFTGSAALPSPQVQAVDRRAVVVIDPGHGGNDPGALNREKTVSERQVNREVASLLLAKLEQHPDEIRPVHTNLGDENLSTALRAAAAMEQGADLLVSLHLNADTNTGSNGFQVFPPPPGWAYHEEGLALANSIAELVAEQTTLQVLGESGIFYAFYEPLANGRYRKDILDAGWYPFLSPRKSETFGVIERCGCPAVLVEQWFITSEADMALMYPDGLETMADILYQAICQTLGVEQHG